MRIGGQSGSAGESDSTSVEEGGVDGDAEKVREDAGVPHTAAQRMKWFLQEEHRKKFVLGKGRTYDFDFFNGYLDFNGALDWIHRFIRSLTRGQILR